MSNPAASIAYLRDEIGDTWAAECQTSWTCTDVLGNILTLTVPEGLLMCSHTSNLPAISACLTGLAEHAGILWSTDQALRCHTLL